MTMSYIFQDTIIENEIYTVDSINREIFSMSALFPEGSTQEGGNNYGKDQLSAYKATSDPDTLYHHQSMKAYNRKELLLAMIK